MTTDTTISLQQFIADNRITATAARVDRNPNMDDAGMDHWRVTLRRPGAKMTVYFSLGRGHDGREPGADDVLDCLASDASTVDEVGSFEEWCAELGYDTDSRSAYRTYTICKRKSERLQKFIGDSDAYQKLLYDVERL